MKLYRKNWSDDHAELLREQRRREIERMEHDQPMTSADIVSTVICAVVSLAILCLMAGAVVWLESLRR